VTERDTGAKAPRGKARARGGKPAQERQLRRAGKRNVAKLLDAALVVFAERGYHAARVDDVCDQAEVSHGTFYLYFASKEDLFRTLVDDVVTEMRDLAGDLPPIGPGVTGYRALRDWLGRFHDLYVRYAPIIQAWNEANAADPELARMGAIVLRRFVDRLLERVAENGTAPLENPAVGALAMVAMVERSITFALAGLVPVEREELLDNLSSFLHVGLFGGRRSAHR
jgi:AcrR family transcriptional regulator